MEYNKIIVGFVVQGYKDGEFVHQEFIAGDEVSYEDPKSGEPIEVDIRSEHYQPLEMIQPCPVSEDDSPG